MMSFCISIDVVHLQRLQLTLYDIREFCLALREDVLGIGEWFADQLPDDTPFAQDTVSYFTTYNFGKFHFYSHCLVSCLVVLYSRFSGGST
jgi:hypothetical protein